MESIAGESKQAITVEVTNNMSNARDIMLEYNISRVIVVANTKPVGMVTEKAIGSYLLKNVASPLDKSRISKAMRSLIITVTADTSIETCVKLMIENKISSLAVIDNIQVNIIILLYYSCKIMFHDQKRNNYFSIASIEMGTDIND
jgi:CBS domain-containing protein